MVYVRFTEEASLFEVSEDFMKLSEELDLGIDDVIDILTYYWGPSLIEIHGETKSGGFASRFVVDAVIGKIVWEWDDSARFVGVIDLVADVVKKKMVGYLRMDGAVRSIREPYRRLFVKITPYQLRRTFVVEWYKKKTIKADMKVDEFKRVVDVLRKFEEYYYVDDALRVILRKKRELPYYVVNNGRVAIEDNICADIRGIEGCPCNKGFMIQKGYSGYVFMMSPHELPWAPKLRACECFNVRHKDEVDVYYLVVPERYCVIYDFFFGRNG